nr:N-acetylmuramidase domain-containing protein [Chromobacterium sphagni]
MRFASLAAVAGDLVAIESCSWGLFQIMGYHWQRLGYASAATFRAAMESGEAAQLEAFARFIEAEPALLKALQAKRWADVAKLYNGPAYKENLYEASWRRPTPARKGWPHDGRPRPATSALC